MLKIFGKARAAAKRRGRMRHPWCARHAVAALLAIVAPAACAAPPRTVVSGDPSDPGAPARAVTYRSTLGPYRSGRPVDPAPWGAQNQRVTPQPKSE